MRVYIGIDDTDSKRSMCTTYVAAVALRRAESLGAKRADLPWLVRLNPNCPYKTRGNAATCLPLEVEPSVFGAVWNSVVETVRELADLENGADPGVAAFSEESRPLLAGLYLRAVRELVELESVLKVCESHAIRYWAFGESRGLIGAAAAAGAKEETLTTYELLAYRTRAMWGKERLIDPESVRRMDELFGGQTFDNYDYDRDEVRITPHTPCPVLLGIRSTCVEVLSESLSVLRINEPLEFYEVFKTNQATDLHYVVRDLRSIRPLESVVVRGRVASEPRVTPGGHVFLKVSDDSGSVTVAAYEPTGAFRWVVARLTVGDEVAVYGSVKIKPEGLTLNLEKLHVLKLKEVYVERAPPCPLCKKSMKSVGSRKGYRCERCGYIDPKATKVRKRVDRGLVEGFYEVTVTARRHLVRPLSLKESGPNDHRSA
ncbi:MAG: tRNA(Ile)(2)-agmatinylcytidine synthase [Thaumarchaeota archaeon]|nr:tRNA(Ile)(2)-agmatinylcytidine synthase [Candidatus Calditenuaceae archaeon]MDW8042461.1 tRNA(Ile)(2)-agmatinylcytidine synthase [Nitrososphaerota archaeon]